MSDVTRIARGTPIGREDRNGRMIRVGDRLSFDESEWGGKMEFTIQLIDGEIVHPGSTGDLSEWCEVLVDEALVSGQ